MFHLLVIISGNYFDNVTFDGFWVTQTSEVFKTSEVSFWGSHITQKFGFLL